MGGEGRRLACFLRLDLLGCWCNGDGGVMEEMEQDGGDMGRLLDRGGAWALGSRPSGGWMASGLVSVAGGAGFREKARARWRSGFQKKNNFCSDSFCG